MESLTTEDSSTSCVMDLRDSKHKAYFTSFTVIDGPIPLKLLIYSMTHGSGIVPKPSVISDLSREYGGESDGRWGYMGTYKKVESKILNYLHLSITLVRYHIPKKVSSFPKTISWYNNVYSYQEVKKEEDGVENLFLITFFVPLFCYIKVNIVQNQISTVTRVYIDCQREPFFLNKRYVVYWPLYFSVFGRVRRHTFRSTTDVKSLPFASVSPSRVRNKRVIVGVVRIKK